MGILTETDAFDELEKTGLHIGFHRLVEEDEQGLYREEVDERKEGDRVVGCMDIEKQRIVFSRLHIPRILTPPHTTT